MQGSPRWVGTAWRAAAVVAGVALAVGVVVALALGSCFDGGGFCANDFDQSNREAFYSAVAMSVGVGPLLVVPFTRRWWALVAASAAGVAVTAAAVALLWP